MKRKDEGNLKNISRKVFIKITRKKAKERINKEFKIKLNNQESQLGGKLTREEYQYFREDFMKNRGKEIVEEEARKARKKATVVALAGTLGISTLYGYQLGAKNNKILGITDGKTSIEIDMNKVDKNVEIENVNKQEKEDKHSLFVKELQESALNENIEYLDTLKQEVTNEIEELKTSDMVLEYVKQFYVDKYNSVNDEQIETADVELYKVYAENVFFKDYAQNGDVILRRCSKADAKEMKVNTVIKQAEIEAFVDKDDNRVVERVGYSDGKFVTLYDKNEEVLANKETVLCDVGNIAFHGLSVVISMDNDKTSSEVKKAYKEDFIQAVVDYKASRNERVNEDNER